MDGCQGITIIESSISNRSDSVRYCNPQQGSTASESTVVDGANGGMKDDLRGIERGLLTIETVTSVDSRCEVGNVLRWQVSTEAERIPTSIFISISSCDCESRSVERESECIRPLIVANESWIDNHVDMWKLHNHNVAPALCNEYDDHDAAAASL